MSFVQKSRPTLFLKSKDLMNLCIFPPASKKILTLGVKGDPPPHPKALQLQKMIRYSATLFVQVRYKKKKNVKEITSTCLPPMVVGNVIWLDLRDFFVIPS